MEEPRLSRRIRTDRSTPGASGGENADAPPASRIGLLGEEAARSHLRGKRYRILAKRLRTRAGEIDLLCRNRRTLVAVEVKTRRSERPEDDLHASQLDRIQAALKEVPASLRRRTRDSRIDLVAVRLDSRGEVRDLLHIPGIRWFP
ncbi:MAG: YraN family protein [Planctomycetota bacterium]